MSFHPCQYWNNTSFLISRPPPRTTPVTVALHSKFVCCLKLYSHCCRNWWLVETLVFVVVVVACCCHRFFFFWVGFHLLAPFVANLVHQHWKILNNYLFEETITSVKKTGEEGCQQRIVNHHFRQNKIFWSPLTEWIGFNFFVWVHVTGRVVRSWCSVFLASAPVAAAVFFS